MLERDFVPFAAMLDDVASVLPHAPAPTAAQKSMFFKAVAEYTIAQVRKALDAHLKDPKRGRFMPTPADVVAQIVGDAADDGRPGAEEAWAMLPRSEAETVVWTEEMAEAFALVSHMLDSDPVAARMSFKQGYDRLVSNARASGVLVRWVTCLGFDKDLQAVALTRAVRAGRITQAIAHEALPTLPPPAEVDRPRLSGPKASAANRRKIDEAVKASILARPRDKAKWARDLRAREESGEKLSDALRQAWRNTLLDSPLAGQMPGDFKPIPEECLPPGMRGQR